MSIDIRQYAEPTDPNLIGLVECNYNEIKYMCGYDKSMVHNSNRIDNDSICARCVNIIRNPIQIQICGHIFCKVCIDIMLNATSNCITCNEKFAKNNCFNDKNKAMKIGRLRVLCPLCRRAKDTNVTQIDNLAEHVQNECKYRVVDCPYKCGNFIEICQIEEHKKVCCNRDLICIHCLKVFGAELKNEVKNHQETCPDRYVLCKLKCGKTFAIKNEEKHIQNNCPNLPVECEYSDIGCKAEITRSQIEEHIKSKSYDHLNIVKTVFQKHTESVEVINKEFKKTIDQHEININKGEAQMIECEKSRVKISSNLQIIDKKFTAQLAEKTANIENKLTKKEETIGNEIKETKNNLQKVIEQVKDTKMLFKETNSKIEQLERGLSETHSHLIETSNELKKIKQLVILSETANQCLSPQKSYHKIEKCGNLNVLIWSVDISPLKNGTSQMMNLKLKFYTSPKGYCAMILITMNKHTNKDYLRISVMLFRGDWDKMLQWPCEGIITLTLLNHRADRDHKIVTFNFDNITQDKINGGESEICVVNQSIDENMQDEENSCYLLNDVMHIRVGIKTMYCFPQWLL